MEFLELIVLHMGSFMASHGISYCEELYLMCCVVELNSYPVYVPVAIELLGSS